MFKEFRLKQITERDLLLKYGDKAAEKYMDRDNFEEDVAILIRTKKTGMISEEDFNGLSEEVKDLLPKKLLIK